MVEPIYKGGIDKKSHQQNEHYHKTNPESNLPYSAVYLPFFANCLS